MDLYKDNITILLWVSLSLIIHEQNVFSALAIVLVMQNVHKCCSAETES